MAFVVRELWQKGEYVELVDILHDAIQELEEKDTSSMTPEELQAHRKKLQLYYNGKYLGLNRIGKYELAIKCANDYIAKYSATEPEPHVAKAEALFALKEYEKAIECLNTVIKLCPREVEPILNKCLALNNLGRYDECLQWADIGLRIIRSEEETTALQESPLDPFEDDTKQKRSKNDRWVAEFYTAKAVALSKQSSWQPALECAEEALRRHPTSSRSLEVKALSLVELNKVDEALEIAEQILSSNPKNILAMHVRTRCLVRSKRLADAVMQLDKIIVTQQRTGSTVLDPVKPYLEKSAVLSMLSKNDDALYVIDEAIRMKPTDKMAWAQRGYCLTRLNRYEEAIKAYEKAISIDPRFKEAFINIGIIQERLGQKSEAMETYRRALQINPKYLQALLNLGRLLLDANEPAEAVEISKKALAVDPKNVEALLMQANAYEKLGMRQHAMAAGQKACQLRPELVKIIQESRLKGNNTR